MCGWTVYEGGGKPASGGSIERRTAVVGPGVFHTTLERVDLSLDGSGAIEHTKLRIERTSPGCWQLQVASVNQEVEGCRSTLEPFGPLLMRRQNVRVEQIVMITDEEENEPPFVDDALERYRRELGVNPNVVIVKVGDASDLVERKLAPLGVEVSAFTFKGDYYALPNLVPLLAMPSRLDLLLEILETPLPRREGH